MAEKPPFTLKGWCLGSPSQETAESLAEAILLTRWSLDANGWYVETIVDDDGEIIMTRDDIVDRANALTKEEAYGP